MKKGIFGLFGMVFFLLAIFVVVGLSLYFNVSLTTIGNPPQMHIDARVVSSEFSNDCDIFLLNILKFRDASTGLTYSELLTIARERNEGDKVGQKIRDLIENDIVGTQLSCLQIVGEASSDNEPFLNYAPYGNCELKTSSNLCQAYVPNIDPEKGYILIKLAIEVA